MKVSFWNEVIEFQGENLFYLYVTHGHYKYSLITEENSKRPIEYYHHVLKYSSIGSETFLQRQVSDVCLTVYKVS